MIELRRETVEGRGDCHLSLPSDYRFPPPRDCSHPYQNPMRDEPARPGGPGADPVQCFPRQRLRVSLLITRPKMSPSRAFPFVAIFSLETRSGHDLIKTNWRSRVEPRPLTVPNMTCATSRDVQKEADLIYPPGY